MGLLTTAFNAAWVPLLFGTLKEEGDWADIFFAYATSVESENSHAFRTLSLGAGWTFSGPNLRTRAID